MENKVYVYKGVPSYEKCPTWLKKVYIISAGNVCMHKNDDEQCLGVLEIHRIIRKTHGGMYTVCKFDHKSNNVKVLCSKHHKQLHAHEKMGHK